MAEFGDEENADVEDYTEAAELFYDVRNDDEQHEDGNIEPEDMNTRVLEMEEELNKLNNAQNQLEKQITNASDKLDELSMYCMQLLLLIILACK